MACILTSGYSYLGCRGGAGGIKAIYLTEIENNSGTGSTFTATAGVVTAYTLATGKKYRTYLLDKEMSMMSNPGLYTPASGTITYEPQIDFTIKKLTTAMIQEIHLVAQNCLTMMVQDVNGDYWLFGKENGMDLLTWSAESGTAITDFNGQKLSFKGKEVSPIYKVTSTLIANLIA
jgi:hypothetical protein